MKDAADRLDLGGKVAIVTGGGRGIGRGIAEQLARCGAAVAVAEIKPEQAKLVANALRSSGAEVVSVPVDVSKRDDVEALVQSVLDRFGRIDVLVNNAAVSLGETFLDTTEETWNKTLAVNLTGCFLCGQRVAQAMIKTKTRGRIVNVASVNSFAAERGAASYVASKGGVLALTRAMAVDLSQHGIIVNAVAFGPIRTEITAPMFDEPSYRAGIERGVPLGRAGTIQEAAAVTALLASDWCSFVNGTAVLVDGGYLAYARLD
jgi:NAD(P)-dependent dehydrogenase (short-subunit alcohol dehydrogenase family)